MIKRAGGPRTALAWFALTAMALGAGPVSAQVVVGDTTGVAPELTPLDSIMTPGRLEIRAMSRLSDVVLRWLPTTPLGWMAGNIGSYRLERATVAQGVQPAPGDFQVLATVTPWGPEQWNGADTTNAMLMAAGATLFGPQPLPAGANDTLTTEDVVRDLETRHTFAVISADGDSLAADALGLRFVDRNVVGGRGYLYRITVGEIEDAPENVDVRPAAGIVRITFTPGGGMPPPANLEMEVGDGELTLQWDPSPQSAEYVGYDVERSSDGGATYQFLNTQPLVYSTDSLGVPARRIYRDTALVNYRTYRYRLYGRSAFGGQGPAAEVVGMPRDLTPPTPPFVTAGEALPESVGARLTWDLDPEELDTGDLRGFFIGHGIGEEGPFAFDSTNVIPPGSRTTSYPVATANASNYYVVAAADTAGNLSYSLPYYVHFIDSVAPSPPANVVARADTSGVVMLQWSRGEEPDLYGYRVFKANAVDHDPTLITGLPIVDTAYADTVSLRTLSRELFYEVTALDESQNPSEPTRVRVVLPDAVAPVPPVMVGVTPGAAEVALAWAPSTSDDVHFQLVLRAEPGATNWQELDTLSATDSTFVDRTVEAGRAYFYIVQAQDTTGLRGTSDRVQTRLVTAAGPRVGVTGLAAAAGEDGVRLTWQFEAPAEGDYWFVVYRAVGGEELRELRSAGSETRFVDDSGDVQGAVRYAVRVFYRDGVVSALSEAVSVDAGR